MLRRSMVNRATESVGGVTRITIFLSIRYLRQRHDDCGRLKRSRHESPDGQHLDNCMTINPEGGMIL